MKLDRTKDTNELLLTIFFIFVVIFPAVCGIGVLLAKGRYNQVTNEIVKADFDAVLAEKGYIHIFFGICGKPLDKIGSGKTIPCVRLLTDQQKTDFLNSSLTNWNGGKQ